jgi:hypothetical protein
MKTIIITGAHESMWPVHNVSVVGKRAWAARWGYDFLDVRQWQLSAQGDPRFAIFWERHLLCHDMLFFAFDRAIWLDADSLITNPSISAEAIIGDSKAAFLASYDYNPHMSFQTGNFVYQDLDDESSATLRLTIDKLFRENPHGEDQHHMRRILSERMPGHEGIQILPGEVLNAVPVEFHREARAPWKPEHFLAHLAGVRDDKRIEWMKAHAQQ